MDTKRVKALAPILAGLIVYLLPVPQGLTPQAWLYFSLFIAVVVGLITEPAPAALIGLMGVLAACLLGVGAPIVKDKVVTNSDLVNWGLSGFSQSTVWLIFAAFMFAMGYEKSGLGKRIALLLVKHLGKRSLGLGYAVVLADTILAPFMPSNTARSGGTIYPIVRNIPAMYGSLPDKEPRKIGAYLMWVGIAGTCVTSSLFMTGLATNVLAMSIMKQQGFSVDWLQWFLAFAPVGIPLLLATPLLAYYLYPPTLKNSEEIPRWAAGELDVMGPLSRKEVIMAGLAVFALSLWILGEKTLPAMLAGLGLAYPGVNATTAALLVLVLMTLLGVVTWDDIIANKQAWNVLVWFATLVALAGGLGNVGFLAWFGGISTKLLSGYGPGTISIGLTVIFFLAHYFFASSTAHAAALLALFLTTAKGVPGLDVPQTALLMCLTLGIMGIITPYGTGPSPIWYGSGYIKAKEFWALGAIFGLLFLGAFLLIGVPWIGAMGFGG